MSRLMFGPRCDSWPNLFAVELDTEAKSQVYWFFRNLWVESWTYGDELLEERRIWEGFVVPRPTGLCHKFSIEVTNKKGLAVIIEDNKSHAVPSNNPFFQQAWFSISLPGGYQVMHWSSRVNNKIDFPFPLFLSHFANDIYHTVIGNPTRTIDFYATTTPLAK